MLCGQHLLAGMWTSEAPGTFSGIDARTGEALEPLFPEATPEEIDRAMHAAQEAFEADRDATPEQRARLLDAIATALDALGDALTARVTAETALPEGRVVGERGRTTAQLRMFARVVRDGAWVDARIDRPQPDRTPVPKPDLRRMLVPLGPVAVFGASNFPLAFSVAGGDTASALAAGCPVVVKAHPAHPGTSELVAQAVAGAVEKSGFHPGTFSLLHGKTPTTSIALVEHPLTRAVGFTGSLRAGRALFDAAAARPHPIPVYAEMGSTNPVFVLPDALEERGEQIARGLAQSVTVGAGQFCTCPGLVFAVEGEALDAFLDVLTGEVSGLEPFTLLHAGIREGFENGLERWRADGALETLAIQQGGDGAAARGTVFTTTLDAFLAHDALHGEVFGPATLVVRCPDAAALRRAARHLDGTLTATLPRHQRRLRRARRPAALSPGQSRSPHCQRLPDGRGGVRRDAPRRPLPRHDRRPQHVGGHGGHRAVGAARRVPKHARNAPATRPPRRQPARPLAHGGRPFHPRRALTSRTRRAVTDPYGRGRIRATMLPGAARGAATPSISRSSPRSAFRVPLYTFPMRHTFSCIDAHTCGNPVRVVVGGAPFLEGATMRERRAHFLATHDWMRTALMFEPRGHALMSGSMLFPPTRADCDVAILFIETSGCLPMCGHGTIGTVTVMIEHGLVRPKEPGLLRLDTPAGVVEARYVEENGRVASVRLVNVPSFLAAEGLTVDCPDLGPLTVDVAYGGNFYAIVDPQENYRDLAHHTAADLLRWSPSVRESLNAAHTFVHPEHPTICGLSHVLWTGAPTQPGADARNAVFYGDAAIDRSPCGTGTSARMAQRAAKGLLKEGDTFVHESIIGSLFTGRVERTTKVSDRPAIVPSIEGWARVTGFNTVFVDDDDPYAHGFLVT